MIAYPCYVHACMHKVIKQQLHILKFTLWNFKTIHRVHSCSRQCKQYITSYSQLQTYSTNTTHHQTFNELSTPRLIREHMTQHTTELCNETIRLHTW